MTMVLEGSERELVEACRRGEREAFRELFEIYRDRVYFSVGFSTWSITKNSRGAV